MELTRKAGLVPERAEFLQYHVHAHLDVFFNGDKVTVPAGIGIDTSNPAVISDDQGVGLTRECDDPCISPLHTHAEDGVLHTETKTPQPNTLGQFFIEWNVPPEHLPQAAHANHRVQPLGIGRLDLTGDEERLREWLGGDLVNVAVGPGDSSIVRMTVATADGGQIVIE